MQDVVGSDSSIISFRFLTYNIKKFPCVGISFRFLTYNIKKFPCVGCDPSVYYLYIYYMFVYIGLRGKVLRRKINHIIAVAHIRMILDFARHGRGFGE